MENLFLILLLVAPAAFSQIYDKYWSYQLPPGRNCTPELWTGLVQPVSDALKELYLSQGTQDSEFAGVRYLVASRTEFDSKLIRVINLDPSVVEVDKGILNIERKRVMTYDLCRAMESPYLYCKKESQQPGPGPLGRCACKSEFPFEYSTLAQVNCVGRLGSVCAIGDDFRLDCADKPCMRGPDNITSYCGGFAAFDARRRALFPERDFSAGVLAKSSLFVIMTTILTVFGALALLNE